MDNEFTKKLLKEIPEMETKEKGLSTEIGAVVFNPDTKEIIEVKSWRQCHSLVRQIIDLLAVHTAQLSWTVSDTSNVLQTANPNPY
jgi:hypothetical protein